MSMRLKVKEFLPALVSYSDNEVEWVFLCNSLKKKKLAVTLVCCISLTQLRPAPPSISNAFFALDGKFLGVGTLKLPNAPRWGRKRRANVPSSIHNIAEINTVKPLLRGHLRDLPKCSLNKGCKNCTMLVNDQHSTATLYCDKVACC